MASASLPQDDPQRNALDHLAAAFEAAAAYLRRAAEEQPPPPPDDDDPLLTVAEAASLLRCSPRHVRDQCAAGKLRAMRDGRRWRVRRSALAAYERRRTR